MLTVIYVEQQTAADISLMTINHTTTDRGEVVMITEHII